MEYKLLCNDIDITDYVLSIKSSIEFDSSTPLIGNAPSKQYSIQINNKSRIMDDIIDKTYEFYQDDILVNTLYCLERPEYLFETIELTLYDGMYKSNINYDTNTNMYPCSVIEQLNEIETILGISIDTSLLDEEFLNRQIGFYDNSEYIRTFLCWIAEACCSNVFCKANGDYIFIPVSKEKSHDIENDDYVYSFKKANHYKCTLIVNELLNIYSGDETGDSLKISDNNPYITKQSDIDYMYDKIGGITFDSVQSLKTRAIEGLYLSHIVHYSDYFDIFVRKIDTTYYSGTKAHNVVEIDGTVDSSIKSDYVGNQNYSSKIKRLKIEVDETNQSLEIVAKEQDKSNQNISKINLDINTINATIKQTREALYGINEMISEINTSLDSVELRVQKLMNKNEYMNGEKIEEYELQYIPNLKTYPTLEFYTYDNCSDTLYCSDNLICGENDFDRHLGELAKNTLENTFYVFEKDSETGEYRWREIDSNEYLEMLPAYSMIRITKDFTEIYAMLNNKLGVLNVSPDGVKASTLYCC